MSDSWRQLINDNERKEYETWLKSSEPIDINTYLNLNEENMKAGKMIPSKFLKKEDIDPAKLVTINGLRQANVALDDQPEEMKWTMFFKELDKPMVLNSTNIQLLCKVLDTDETDEWIGKEIVVFNDQNVSFGGKITGGIRIRAPKKQALTPEEEKIAMTTAFDDDIPF